MKFLKRLYAIAGLLTNIELLPDDGYTSTRIKR